MFAFHLTSPEGTVIGACVTAAGYMVLSKRQKASTTITVEAKDILSRVENRVDDLARTLMAHTADDAANFRELRETVRRPRRFGLGGLLATLVRMFF